MGKSKRVLRCYHCGAILQCENPNEKGYIIPESLNRATPIQIIYCDKCFETMKAFNNSQLDLDVDQEVLKILDDAYATDAYILWVVDLFSFNGTLNKEIADKVKKLNVTVIGTKRDLFPQNVKDESLIAYLTERFNEFGIKPLSVRLMGSTNKMNPKEYIDAMNVDIKSMSEATYKNFLKGDLKTTKAFIERAVKDCHVELTMLIVPGMNDTEDEMRELTSWIAGLTDKGGKKIGSEIPLHISRFFPRYEMSDTPPTDVGKIYALADIAREKLKDVYTGNC